MSKSGWIGESDSSKTGNLTLFTCLPKEWTEKPISQWPEDNDEHNKQQIEIKDSGHSQPQNLIRRQKTGDMSCNNKRQC